MAAPRHHNPNEEKPEVKEKARSRLRLKQLLYGSVNWATPAASMNDESSCQRLLEAALEWIWSRSFGVVVVEAIWERADVRKVALHHFFPSNL